MDGNAQCGSRYISEYYSKDLGECRVQESSRGSDNRVKTLTVTVPDNPEIEKMARYSAQGRKAPRFG